MRPPRGVRSVTDSSGVALVVTLMMMSILVMMVVGLAGVMRNEQAAARNLTYQVLAEQVAEVGARQGINAVFTSTPAAGQLTATGPGWMLAGNTTRYLFSPADSDKEIKNLERIGTNSLILGLPTGVRGSIFVGWSNLVLPGQPTNRPIARYAWWVDDEGTKLNLNAVGSNNTDAFLPFLTNFPFSADWVFADPVTGTTNQTNFAQAQALRSRVQWLPTPESLKGSNFLNFTNPQVSGGTNNLLRVEDYHRIKGQVTTWSSNADLTPWGWAKVNLAGPALTAAQIKAMLTTNAWANFFGPDISLARKYGGGTPASTNSGNFGDYVMDQIVANIEATRGQWAVPRMNTNIFLPTSPQRHRESLPMNALGWPMSAPMLNEVAVSVGYQVTGNVMTCRFVVASEIWNPWPTDASGYQLEIRPRKFRFFISTVQAANPLQGQNPSVKPKVTPPPGTSEGEIILGAADTENPNGVTGSSPNGCWIGPMMENSTAYPVAGLPIIPLPTIASKSLVQREDTFVYDVDFSTDPLIQPLAVMDAYVQIDRVVLRDGSGRALDWVTLDDFAMAQNFGSANTTLAGDYGQLNFSPVYPFGTIGSILASPTTSAGFDPTQAMGLAKNDPRVRLPLQAWNTSNPTNGLINTAGFFPASLQAWYQIGPNQATLGSPNAAPAVNFAANPVPFLAADPVPAGANQTDHPHFALGYLPTGGFKSVAQLGAIHTGLPWRTLRFQPTSAAELAQGPPDWVLLDAFTAANPGNLLPRVNLNGLVTSLQASNNTNPGVPVNSASQSQTRPWPLLGTMGALRTNLSTNGGTNAFASNGVVWSLTTNTNAAFSTNRFLQVAASLSNALVNPNLAGSSWAAGSGWAARRAAVSSNFPPNGFALTGELLELQNVADDATLGEDVIESRLRGFLDMVTTRSDTFSVWSIGQGLVVVTNSVGTPVRTNVMGEVRKQTVFQREPVINAAGVVTGYQLRTLYTRNHIVQ